ncbi:MAG TPA: pitrilysin family protein [Gammaproteobacteria bacterium]
MLHTKILRLTVALLLLPLAACAAVPAAPTTETLLDNGMRVIVREDHRAPVVVSQVWYQVGSSYEYDGITGISHVLEHMMFKGTAKHGAGEFSRIIAENGGRENAFTGNDYTAYFQQLEKSRLPISLELESDRMRNLLLPPEEFAKEVKVVMEERRMRTDDNPDSLTYEQFMAAAFQVSPYHHPVIGWMTDLEHLDVADLRQWYQKWYAPNNATLVVVGDVKSDEVFALAKKYFGDYQPSTIEPPKPRNEPPQLGERRIVVKAPAELPSLIMGYQAPSLHSTDAPWKAYALEVLAALFDGGESARLARELVRGQQIAASASASYGLTDRLGTLFTFSGTPANGHDIASLEQALRTQVRRVRDEMISNDELTRIKAQVTAAKVYERDSVFYQAMQIGTLATVGLDWHEADRYAERINAITAEQVRAVAREFLIDDHLTVAQLDPQPIDHQHPPASSGMNPGAMR